MDYVISRRKNLSLKTKMSKYVIGLLLIIAITVSSSSFAYWYTFIGGADTQIEEYVQVGYGKTAETAITLTTDQGNSDQFLVPVGQLINSVGKATEEVVLNYRLNWREKQAVTQVAGQSVYGVIHENIKIDIIQNDIILDKEVYTHLYDLIEVTPFVTNTDTILLNNQTPVDQYYSVTMNEPSNKTDYEMIKLADIVFSFNYEIKTDVFDLDLDFTTMTKQELLDTGAIFNNSDDWYFNGSGLINKKGQTKLLIPINKEEFTLTVEAKLSQNDNLQGGYGIFFDTVLSSNDVMLDSGNIFQFDRGYSDGYMIVRPRVNGSEKNPVWSISSRNDQIIPDKFTDTEWWESVHEITIEVIVINETTMQATFLIDGVILGQFECPRVDSSLQKYVGFRGWHDSPTEYYSLRLK